MSPRARTWMLSALGSAVLIGLLASVTDVAALKAVANTLPWPLVAGALALWQIEGICTAARVHLLAGAGRPVLDSLVVTAWWVGALALLPARLGELAGVHALVRRLGMPFGAALNSLFLQRLLDGLLLLALGALAIAAQSGLAGRELVLLALLAATVLGVLLIARLQALFAFTAKTLVRVRGMRLGRPALRAALSGRRAAAAIGDRGLLARLALATLGKWLASLAAMALLIAALAPIPGAAAATAAALFNLAAIVPLQTVGGIGIGDVTLAGVLGYYGVDAARAAAAALLVRALVLAAPLVFWLLVMLVAGIGPRGDGRLRWDRA